MNTAFANHEHRWLPLKKGYPVFVCRCGAVRAPGGIVAGSNTISIGADITIDGSAGTSGQFLKTQGSGVSPVWSNAGDFAAGSLLAASSNASKTITPMTYTKAKEIQIYRGGTLRISFALEAATPPYTVYGRIYKNGFFVGAERSTGAGPDTFAEDISGWAAGDYVQIYAHTGNTLYAAYITNFQLFVAAIDKFLVTLD